MTQGMLVLGAVLVAFTTEGIIACVLVGMMFGLITYYFAKRWNQDSLAGVGLVLCIAGGAFGGLWGALALMIVMLVCADYSRREAEKARRQIKIFKVGDTDFGVSQNFSLCAIDRTGATPLLSIEVQGNSLPSASGPWPVGAHPTITIKNASALAHDNMVEARFPADASAAAGIMLRFTSAGDHAIEDLCVRLHNDGLAEVFGVVTLDGDRKPLRISCTPRAAPAPRPGPDDALPRE